MGGIGDLLRYLNADDRATLGHFAEHVWMSDEQLSRMRSLAPSYPPLGARAGEFNEVRSVFQRAL